MKIRLILGLLLFGRVFSSTLDFSQIETLPFHSQASQDKFVYSLLYGLLDKQDPGYYLEVGAGEPIHINNSYFFEKMLHWKGVSIDISEDLSERWYAARSNPLVTEDATRCNYSKILKPFPKVIDYLSLDIDGFYDVVLEKIPFDHYVFKVITIEHDFYRYGDQFRKKERLFLEAHGYHLLCANVMNAGCAFEDWWIHPSAFPPETFAELKTLDLQECESSQMIDTLLQLVK